MIIKWFYIIVHYKQVIVLKFKLITYISHSYKITIQVINNVTIKYYKDVEM